MQNVQLRARVSSPVQAPARTSSQRRSMNVWSLAAALFVLMAFERIPRVLHAQQIDVHPTAANLRSIGSERSVGIRDTTSGDANLDRMSRRLRRAVRTDSVGDQDGDEATVIGTINDIAVDSRGRIFVLDMAFQSIRVFDANGNPAFMVGQKGSGPLDLRFGVSIWAEDDGAIAVTDVVLGTKYLALESKAKARLLRTVPSIGDPSSACGSNGSLITFSTTAQPGDKPLRRVGLDGRELRRFGEGYAASTPLVRMIMSEGTVGCMRDGSTISALSKLPLIVNHDQNGAVRWRLRLRDFIAGREIEEVDEKSRRSIGLDPKNPTSSYVYRVAPIGDGHAAIQVGLRTARSIRERVLWARLDTYLVEVATGKAVFVSSSLPMVDELRGTELFGFDNDPYPRVLRLRVAP